MRTRIKICEKSGLIPINLFYSPTFGEILFRREVFFKILSLFPSTSNMISPDLTKPRFVSCGNRSFTALWMADFNGNWPTVEYQLRASSDSVAYYSWRKCILSALWTPRSVSRACFTSRRFLFTGLCSHYPWPRFRSSFCRQMFKRIGTGVKESSHTSPLILCGGVAARGQANNGRILSAG